MNDQQTKPKRKASRATVLRRVDEVLRIRLDGAAFWDVREYAREQAAKPGSAWHRGDGAKPLSDGQLWRYISRADQLLFESTRISARKRLRRSLARLEYLYSKAVLQGDVKAALAVMREGHQLLGMYPTREDQLAAELEDTKRLLEEIQVSERLRPR
jgi:hypothetical protein